MLLLCFRRLKSFASQLLARVDLSIWHFIRINRLLSPFVHVLFEATGMSISSTTAAGGLTSGVATGLPQAYSIASGKEMEAGKYLVRARRVQIVSFRKLGVPYFGVLIYFGYYTWVAYFRKLPNFCAGSDPIAHWKLPEPCRTSAGGSQEGSFTTERPRGGTHGTMASSVDN